MKPDDLILLSVKDAARMIGKSEDWLRHKLRQGIGPKAYRVSERCTQIKLSDLHKWVDELDSVNRPRLIGLRDGKPMDPMLQIECGEDEVGQER